MDKFENSSIEDAIEVDDKKGLHLGFGQIPELLLDNTDRNRTSPFAFTGNRFEFRAPGSSVNCGSAMLALNSAVAYQLQQFKKDVEALQAEGKSKEVAIFKVLKAYIKESKPIRFDGNGYSDEWKEEAAKRGLDCQNSVPLQYDAYLKPESIEAKREYMKSYDYLISYNIKPSVQRIAIMDYLLAHKTHPSIDEIYLALCKDIPTLSKTTVYNTLKLFVEHGAALMLTIDEKNACFDGDTSLHAHFLCKKCGKIFDLPYSNEVKQVEQIDMNGFKVDEIHQYYKGICPVCSKEDKEKS